MLLDVVAAVVVNLMLDPFYVPTSPFGRFMGRERRGERETEREERDCISLVSFYAR